MEFKSFPTTRYQGSKRKILDWIYYELKDLPFNTVLDVFGGTASVSYLFKKMNKTVTFNDNLHFNFLIGKAIIENDNILLPNEDIEAIISINTNNNFDFIQNNFENIYYKAKENAWIDNAIFNILNMNHYKDEILEYKKAIAYYSLFQACLVKRPFNLFHRRNLHLRTNKNVKRSFGNFRTWERPFSDLFLSFALEANKSIFSNGYKNKAINYDAINIPYSDYDLIYVDPPYYKKNTIIETSNYLKVYHFLEGLSIYNNWTNHIDYATINLRLKDSYKHCSFLYDSFIEDLDCLIDKFQKSIFVISYKKGGYPSIQTITKLLKKYKKKVYTRSKHYKYALNHQNGDAIKNREVLIIGHDK